MTVTVKQIIGNELLKEIIAIRTDSLWKLLAWKAKDQLPKVQDEGAVGDFDNKGALFVPGGLVFEDSDRGAINYQSYSGKSITGFKKAIREAMQVDNATLLGQDGYATGVNLNNGFFSDIAGQIIAIKEAAKKKQTVLPTNPPGRFRSSEITRSFCPAYIPSPYGARTRISSCLAACYIEPRIYYLRCRAELSLRGKHDEIFWNGIRESRKPIQTRDGATLAAPQLVVCHTTRFKEEVIGGMTRILGIGQFGEFATFTHEEATRDLLHELESEKEEFTPADIFAEYEGIKAVGVLRIHPKTTPGKRLKRTTTYLISPQKDLDLDVEAIEKEARKRYGL